MGDDSEFSYGTMSQVAPMTVCETLIPGTVALYDLSEVHYAGESEFQQIHVVKLDSFGKTLLLDKRMQSTSSDEFIYHETLVMPAMMTHANPKQVFICGGGEGATAREVLRVKSVEKCLMVDIDGKVVETSKDYLDTYHLGAFDNLRLDVVIDDAKKQLFDSPDGAYDVIISDLSDPVEDNPCWMMYTIEYYQELKKKLAPGGIFVSQSGPSGLYVVHEVTIPIYNTLKRSFKYVHLYTASIPSFMDHYAFVIASDDVDVSALTAEEIDKRISERISATHEIGADASKVGEKALSAYDGETHEMMYRLPKWLRTKLANNTEEIITEASPKFVS